MNDNLGLIDILTILSFVIGIENLNLNIDQINSLDKHLEQQDNILINEQNEMLKKIIEQNEEIIKLLKENKNA